MVFSGYMPSSGIAGLYFKEKKRARERERDRELLILEKQKVM